MTQQSKPSLSGTWVAYGYLTLAGIIYLVVTMLTPINGRRSFYLSHFAIHALQLTIVLPLIAIWFIAMWGSLRFKAYAKQIEESPDGKALNTLSNGLLTLVSMIALTTVVQSFNQIMLQHGDPRVWTIAMNYLSVFTFLIAFIFIFIGSYRLAKIVRLQSYGNRQAASLVVLAIMGVIYVWLLAHNPYRGSSPDPQTYTSYYLPDKWILGTIVLPYMVMWYLGLMAAACLRIYQKFSSGIIYRRALQNLSNGMIMIIAASLLIQLLSAVAPSLARLGLTQLLLVIYVLIIAYAAGHVLVALGARKLARIEEVAGDR